MNPRKEATYRMLSLIAAVIFVLPCVFLVFPIFDINPDDLWQMDSLMEFICAYKNTAILAIVGVLIQIVIALPAGYAIARIPSPKAQTFFLLTCVFFLLLPQQALMLPQYLVLMNIGWLDSLKGLLIMTAFQPVLLGSETCAYAMARAFRHGEEFPPSDDRERTGRALRRVVIEQYDVPQVVAVGKAFRQQGVALG